MCLLACFNAGGFWGEVFAFFLYFSVSVDSKPAGFPRLFALVVCLLQFFLVAPQPAKSNEART